MGTIPVEQQVAEFRNIAAAFARSLNRAFEIPPQDPDEVARANLKATRAVFGKWSLEILVALYSLGIVGFQDLRRHLSGVSSRVLSSKLKALEGFGLLSRKVLVGRPPRVQYRLTESGLNVAHLGEPVILYLRYLASQREAAGEGPPADLP